MVELHTVKVQRGDAEVKIIFDHDYPERQAGRPYDPAPEYYAVIHLPEKGYTPKGKKVETRGYGRVRIGEKAEGEGWSVAWYGGYLHRVGVPAYVATDLPYGYAAAVIDDFRDVIQNEMATNLDTIERQARRYEAEQMGRRAEGLEKQAAMLRENAAAAVAGEEYLTQDEIERKWRI